VVPGEIRGLAILFAIAVSLQFYTAELGNTLNSFLDEMMGTRPQCDLDPTGANSIETKADFFL
jgi:hypothetical protein